jgi:hypothetical protein
MRLSLSTYFLFRDLEIVFVGGYGAGSGSASVFKLNIGTGTCYAN